ncbi:MAG TPA: MFS transporter [Pseudomonadales bacterium]|jgi:predicted MFS family arabinose efflux permease|nr:MFS transporter [Pseudomonadales bacterium]
MAEATLAGREKSFSTAYQWYALGVLFVVYVFNFIDRSVLALLAQSIKDDLQISDTALGLLGGLAFAVFYTGLGIPIARLADKGNRRNILVVCLSIWSAATALCGLAHSYAYLLLARIGVAVGEAGGSPPSHSMISDMFPQHRRATALGIYALGIPVGSMIGALAGGWINDAFDWRTAFMIVGLPGLLLAVVVRLTLQEPPRGVSEPVRVEAGAAPPIGAVFRLLWQRPSFRWLSMSAGFQAFVSYGAGAWIPPMFERTHGLSSSQIGTALFWLGFASVIGTFAGGWYGDRLGRRDVRWYMWLPALTTLAWLPFQAFCYLTSDPWLAFWVMAIPNVLGSYWLAPVFSLTQGLVGLRMRAVAASIMLFVLNIIGMGLGPGFVGILSDLLDAYTSLGLESLRWSLVISLSFALVAVYCCMRGARSLQEDLARSQEPG